MADQDLTDSGTPIFSAITLGSETLTSSHKTKLDGIEAGATAGADQSVITWTSATQIGSDLNISASGNPSLATLNETDIAFVDDSNGSLSTYRFNGLSWTIVGSGLDISPIGNSALAALNGTDVAFFDSTNDDLRVYRFGFSIGTPYRP